MYLASCPSLFRGIKTFQTEKHLCWQLWNDKGIQQICRCSFKTTWACSLTCTLTFLHYHSPRSQQILVLLFSPTCSSARTIASLRPHSFQNVELWARLQGHFCPSLGCFTHAWSSVQLSRFPRPLRVDCTSIKVHIGQISKRKTKPKRFSSLLN